MVASPESAPPKTPSATLLVQKGHDATDARFTPHPAPRECAQGDPPPGDDGHVAPEILEQGDVAARRPIVVIVEPLRRQHLLDRLTDHRFVLAYEVRPHQPNPRAERMIGGGQIGADPLDRLADQ